MTCTQCGTGLNPDTRFCPSCGTPAPEAAAPPPPPASPPTPAAPDAGAAPPTMAIPANWQQGMPPPGAPTPPAQAPPAQAPPGPGWGGTDPAQAPPPGAGWGAPTPASGPVTRNPIHFLLPAAGVVAFFATFLPWYTLKSGSESETFNGFGDGVSGPVTMVLALAMIAFGLVKLLKGRVHTAILVLAIIASAFVFLLGAADISDVNETGDLKVLTGLDASAGIGLYLVTLAGVVGVVGASLLKKK